MAVRKKSGIIVNKEMRERDKKKPTTKLKKHK